VTNEPGANTVMRGQKRVVDALVSRASTPLPLPRRGWHRSSGLPEVRSLKRRKSSKLDLRCQAWPWRLQPDRATNLAL